MNEDMDPRTLPFRRYAHPFDRPVKIKSKTRGVNPGRQYIGGYGGIGWEEAFRCHKDGQVYLVSCSDGVENGKSSHSNRDLKWMETMRDRIVARTKTARRGPIKLAKDEWAIMLHFVFTGWLDPLPGEKHKTVGDTNRHLNEGQIGTIGGIAVIIDPNLERRLPEIGDFREDPLEQRLAPKRKPRTEVRGPSKFGGLFAAAFEKAGISA